MTPATEITDEALAVQVERFYDKVRRDPLIGPVFETAIDDWPEHLVKLTDFWSSVTLATGRYRGRPMPAHMKLPLEPRMFDRWLFLWGETADELFAPAQARVLREKAARIGQSLSLAMFFRPEDVRPKGD
ncbi:group III truncated hemoglobin [Caulobacter sp. 17J80-11]|uniref:group III truncated hemoglobin n=1 Tax=Caulobacter sp. 17J80-11 TaxID=2763502 RepID=UPI0016534EA3|nr:group III truncated hemoglobin [Caulobacter sp. 17J80-11]MBC6980320.1 group III truncated hemoglobin [Caulobacter sp. 17J80-11]